MANDNLVFVKAKEQRITFDINDEVDAVVRDEVTKAEALLKARTPGTGKLAGSWKIDKTSSGNYRLINDNRIRFVWFERGTRRRRTRQGANRGRIRATNIVQTISNQTIDIIYKKLLNRLK